MDKILVGTGVALATPMNNDLSIDYDSLEKLVNHIIDGGVDYLVVQGTTGESPTCSWKEKKEILSFVIERNSNRVPILFGLGGNDTRLLIEQSKELSELAFDAYLSVSPYYSRPSQKGIIKHYQMLADEFTKPMVLYNVPARTGSNVSAETTLALSEHENIIGMKEASGDLSQCDQILKGKNNDFLLLSGDDQITLKMIQNGAEGVISVAANLLPVLFSKMVRAAVNGHFEDAILLDNQLSEAYKLLTLEGNPSSLKTGLNVQSMCKNVVRPPLVEGSQNLMEQWSDYLSNLKA